jgi:hypothetical protein
VLECEHTDANEGVHEIQLNGKQLVFMFMAVTVVAVVIFLCGVMVGGAFGPHTRWKLQNRPPKPRSIRRSSRSLQ